MKKEGRFSLINFAFCILTPTYKHEVTSLARCIFQQDEAHHFPMQQLKLHVELKAPSLGPHSLCWPSMITLGNVMHMARELDSSHHVRTKESVEGFNF
jgi:hypothetical protein